MSDFMPWLYAHYIKPQIDAAPKGDYIWHMDALLNNLRPSDKEQLAKALEFTAIQAFLLGLRTGEGLARQIPAGSPEARSSGPTAAVSRQ